MKTVHCPGRRYRLVRWDQFRQRFASTREHMRDGNGEWLALPPSWPCFVAAGVLTYSCDLRVCCPASAYAGGGQYVR